MSVVVEREVHEIGRVQRPGRVVRRPRTGETRRPPTRARVVAGRRPSGVASCAPRTVAPRWTLLLALGAAVCLGVVGLGTLAGGVAGGGEATVPVGTAVVSVSPGDTLWDVAQRTAPGSDPAAVVERIQELNGLTGAAVDAGVPLVVPAEA
ncbi:LysM peptidoglycan-binding domain-containing protein [Prauserella cavernicola]|uniref:LysM peptidoglycan-binding domain-containing protein n=1 Tax=Prauserella cavernicola TaxID=2800127 RepID=A0A934V905_9PSEU|nr:LysM peptidoglycan-binding domain-containing protein [Prauserella cavernicola]MBK1788338.1 LysM peptidoglycan-binding domain-containing protein [Prauserella cavernicola]